MAKLITSFSSISTWQDPSAANHRDGLALPLSYHRNLVSLNCERIFCISRFGSFGLLVDTTSSPRDTIPVFEAATLEPKSPPPGRKLSLWSWPPSANRKDSECSWPRATDAFATLSEEKDVFNGAKKGLCLRIPSCALEALLLLPDRAPPLLLIEPECFANPIVEPSPFWPDARASVTRRRGPRGPCTLLPDTGSRRTGRGKTESGSDMSLLRSDGTL